MLMLRIFIFVLATYPLTGLAQYADDEFCAQLAEMESMAAEHLNEFTELSEEWADEFVGLISNGEAKGDDLLPDNWASHSLHVQIASCYATGKGTDRDINKAMAFLEAPAQSGFPSAVHILASLRLFETDDPSLQRLGFEELEQEYKSGSAFAAGKLGWAYQKGLGVNPDQDKALEFYEYAAKSGMTYWQYLLAHAYEKGYLGLDVDLEKAAFWKAFKPKIHIALYECWVASYYGDGTFPANDELRTKYQETCDETDLGEWWASFNSE
jgi:TPR repeat protein